MSYVKNWLHCVWGTKTRFPFITGKIKDDLINHIKEYSKGKGIYIDIIDGDKEHLHCLISLNPDQSLADVIQLIKGESSFWVNKNKLTAYNFRWSVDYFGVSVSESHLEKVRNYIRTQESHHNTKLWEDEVDELIKEYGFNKYSGERF
jgi:putative transposase